MQNFTPGQIQKAYARADVRVIDAMSAIPIDSIITTMQQHHALEIDRSGNLRAMVDYVLIGLMSARDLSTEIGGLFPTFKEKIISELNTKIFRPVLEYVRTHEPEDMLTPEQPTDAFATSHIELVANQNEEEDVHPTNLTDESAVFARSGIILGQEEREMGTSTPVKTNAIAITEEIESDPAHNVTFLEHVPDKPGASKPTYHHDPYQETL